VLQTIEGWLKRIQSSDADSSLLTTANAPQIRLLPA
jgi:hypothetical protein